MNQPFNFSLLVKHDGTWCVVKPVSRKNNKDGSVQYELFGKIYTAKKYNWRSIKSDYSDKELEKIVIDQNINELSEAAFMRDLSKKEEENRRNTNQVFVPDDDSFDFTNGCNCPLCRS